MSENRRQNEQDTPYYDPPYHSADEIEVPVEPVDMPVPEAPNPDAYQPQQPDPVAENARMYAEAEQRALAERYAAEEYARQERERQEYLRKEEERRAARRRAENKKRLEAEMRARELAAAQEPVEVDPQATADPEKHYYKLTVIAEDGREREPLYFDSYSDYKEALEAAKSTGYMAEGYEVTKEEYEQAVWGKEADGPEMEDQSFVKRMERAQNGRKSELAELMKDEDYRIRVAVAERGYGLEQLSQDIDPRVRAAVVRQGYGLDKALDTDHNELVQRELLLQGYRLGTLMESNNPKIRAGVAEQGYGLDQLVQDEDWRVRATVARYGGQEHLEALKRDTDPRVRASVADRGYALDELYRDDDPHVRRAAAGQLYKTKSLDSEDRKRLASDPDWRVRWTVAMNGVETERLSNDPSPAVAKAATRAKAGARKLGTGAPGAGVNAAIAAAQKKIKAAPKVQKSRSASLTLKK